MDKTCGDCELFKLSTGKCSWGIRECRGPKAKHASKCPLFMQDGIQWMLDCDEEDLPSWAHEQLELSTIENDKVQQTRCLVD